MKIAFIGTHCSGKSTIVDALFKPLSEKYGLPPITLKEVASRCPYGINEDSSFKAQLWILINQISGEMSLSNERYHLLCDRSVYDNLAYSCILKDKGKITLEELSEMIRIAESWGILQPYDFLFYLPPLPLVHNSWRSIDYPFQQAVDGKINEIIRLLKLDVIRLPVEPINPRVVRIMTILDGVVKV